MKMFLMGFMVASLVLVCVGATLGRGSAVGRYQQEMIIREQALYLSVLDTSTGRVCLQSHSVQNSRLRVRAVGDLPKEMLGE